MNISLQKVIESIATDVVVLARGVMNEQRIADDSDLIKNMRTVVNQSAGSVVIKVLFDNFINYIEQGRAPMQGKRPPIDALRDWAIGKGIEPDNDTLWAISTAIWRDGIAPRPLLALLEARVSEQFEEKWANELFDSLMDGLTIYFNS